MTTSRSQTKHELQRISSKINQLKRKYPTYADQEICKDSLHFKEQSVQMNINEPAYLYQKQKMSINPRQRRDSFSNNTRKVEVLDMRYVNKENCNLKNKQSMNSTDKYQKPYQQYKEQLNVLKKQILSSLDFENYQHKKTAQLKNKLFQQSNMNIKVNQKIKQKQNNQNAYFYQNQLTSIPNSNENRMKSFYQCSLKNQDSAISMHNSIQYQNATTQHLITAMINSKVKEQIQSSNNKFQDIKNMFNHLSIQLNEYKNKSKSQFLTLNFVMNKLQSKQIQIQDLITINSNKIQQKPNITDLKYMQIQNQSFNKLSKEVWNQINRINCSIQSINQNLVQKDNHQNSKVNISDKRIQQFEEKHLRNIFDLKNQIQLIGQKLNKTDYLQKSLKLLSQKSHNPAVDMNKINQNLISNDKFILKLSQTVYNYIQESIQQAIQNRSEILIQDYYNKVVNPNLEDQFKQITNKFNMKIQNNNKQNRNYIQTSIEKYLNPISNSLRQYQTKLVSYRILIKTIQQNLNQYKENKQQKQNSQSRLEQTKQQLLIQMNNLVDQKLKNLFISTSNESTVDKKQSSLQTQSISKNSNLTIFGQFDQSKVKSQQQQQLNDHSACLLQNNHKDQQDLQIIQSERFFQIPLNEKQEKPLTYCFLDQLLKNSLTFQAFSAEKPQNIKY